jgi:hypothetical protein
VILITFRAWNRPLLRPDCSYFEDFLKPHSLSVPPLNPIGNLDCGSLLPLSSSQPAVDTSFDPTMSSCETDSSSRWRYPIMNSGLKLPSSFCRMYRLVASPQVSHRCTN